VKGALDGFRWAVLYLGLTSTVMPSLYGFENEEFAAQAVAACWRWVEQGDVSGKELLDLYHAEDDSGVDTIMYNERNDCAQNAWGCVGVSVAYTAYCAYMTENGVLPELLELANSRELFDAFLRCFQKAGGDQSLLDLLGSRLMGMHEDHLRRRWIDPLAMELLKQNSGEVFISGYEK